MKARRWTPQERSRAESLLNSGFTYRKAAETLTVEFGHKRTFEMVRKQVRRGYITVDKMGAKLRPSAKNDSSSAFQEDKNYAVLDGIFSENKAPTLEQLLDKFNVSTKEWEVLSFRVNQWDVAAKENIDGKVVWVPHTNYQARANLVRKVPVKCQFPPVRGAKVGAKKSYYIRTRRTKNLDVVVPDSQVGFKRNLQSGELTPLHDLRAFDIVTSVIKRLKPDRVVLLGDMLDLPDWSTHFVHSPEFAFTTQASLDWMASWIKEIRGYCAKLVYIEGNHEKRMMDFIIRNRMQAFDIRPANEPDVPPVMSIPYLLGLHKMDVEYVGNYPSGEFYINNNLVCIHGHKVGAKSGQSVTKILDDARISTIMGHVHRMEMAHKTIWTQGKPKIYQAVSLGTIARIDGLVASGSARHNWQQGFGVVEYDDENFQIDTVGIYEGKSIYRGESYESSN